METPEQTEEGWGDRSNDALADAVTRLAVTQMQLAMAIQLVVQALGAAPEHRSGLLDGATREARAALKRSADIATPYLGPDAATIHG